MKIGIYLKIWLVKGIFPQYWKVPVSLIYAQAKHETGNFKSAVYKENNNLFGMKLARKRKNTITGENRGHATYKSRLKSIYDYFLRQQYFHINYVTPEQYVTKTVQSGYAEDSSYNLKWLGIYYAIPGIYRIIPYIVLPIVVIAVVLLVRKNYL